MFQKTNRCLYFIHSQIKNSLTYWWLKTKYEIPTNNEFVANKN